MNNPRTEPAPLPQRHDTTTTKTRFMHQEDITKLLTAAILEVRPSLQGRPLGPGDSLEALGLDSMERADILMLVLERMDLRIPLVQTFGPRNIGELVRLLSEKSAA